LRARIVAHAHTHVVTLRETRVVIEMNFSFLFSRFSLDIKNVTKVLKYLKSLLVQHESISSFLIAFLIYLFFSMAAGLV